jgi:hypothetical protein
MTDATLQAVALARDIVALRYRGLVGFDVVPLSHAIIDLSAETERLAFELHRRHAHPDFEYATIKTARKSGDDPRLGLEGDGWEPNDVVECHEYKDGAVVKERWRNWEVLVELVPNYWRRRKTP